MVPVKLGGDDPVGRTETGDISQVAMQKSGFPERQLWCAVVERALQDAIGPAAASARDENRRPERQDALHWFLENGHDYQMACDAAGIDAEYLRHHVLSLAGKNGETR
jgi:hypothetical protein